MGVSGQRHAPAALYPRGKDPRYPFDRRLGLCKIAYCYNVGKGLYGKYVAYISTAVSRRF
jgi:hypothetical protein